MLVTVVPSEAKGVASHRLGLHGAGRRAEHGQLTRLGVWRIARLAIFVVPLLVAQRARAGIAQILEAVLAAVAVFPRDVHTCPGGQVHFDRLRVGRAGWKRRHGFSIRAGTGKNRVIG